MSIVRELRQVSAELRHAYAHLANGTVGDQQKFADGLLAPQIRRLEQMAGRLETKNAESEVDKRAATVC